METSKCFPPSKSVKSVLLLFLIWKHLISFATGGVCPNDCSGHGVCNFNAQCECFADFKVVADCSQRKCPYDLAWADKASSMDVAHASSECSSRGLCNRRTGLCDCFKGYEGIACQRMTCPNDCSGHGDCHTIQELYADYTKYKPAVISSGSFNNYTLWDAHHSTACVCDIGYDGASCEMNICPKGDDPLTPSTGHPSITIRTLFNIQKINDDDMTNNGISSNRGYFRITLFNQTVFIPIQQFQTYVNSNSLSPPLNTTSCNHLFQSNWYKIIKEIQCIPTLTANGIDYNITFLSFVKDPYENNLFGLRTDGRLDMSDFYCEPYFVSNLQDYQGVVNNKASCEIIDTTLLNVGLPEYATCSNRGVCDPYSGTCKCYDYFDHINCDLYTPSSLIVPPSKDIYLIESKNPFSGLIPNNYSNNILSIHSTTNELNKNSNYIQVTNNVDLLPLLELSGQGDLILNYGGVSVETGMTVLSDGLVMNDGKMTVLTGGLVTSDGDVNITAALHYPLIALNLKSPNAGLNVTASTTATVGNTMVPQGYLKVIQDGMHIVDGGVTVYTDGFSIGSPSTDITPATGLYVYSGGMTVVTGGLNVTGNVVVNAGGIDVRKGMTVTTGGITVSGNTRVYVNAIFKGNGRALLIQEGGMTIADDGLVVNNSLTILDSYGLNIITGGMTVENGGVIINNNNTLMGSSSITTNNITDGLFVTGGGMTISDHGLMIINTGITVYSGGIHILNSTNGSLNISHGGLTVTSQGVSVADGWRILNSSDTSNGSGKGSMTIFRGMTIFNGGLLVDQGRVRVLNNGLKYRSNNSNAIGIGSGECLSIASAGLKVFDGLTIHTGGVKIRDVGVNITKGGIVVVEGGIVLENHGSLYVNRSMTIHSGGIMILNGGMQLLQGGLVNQGGDVVINNDGVVILNATSNQVNLGGLTVGTTGGSSTSGVIIDTDGLHVTMNGISILQGGLQLTSTSAVQITGGIMINDNLSILQDSLVLKGGLTIPVNGIESNSRVEILSGGLVVTSDGLVVGTNGLTVFSGGMTINNGGVGINTQGVTISHGGLVVSNSGNITVDSLNVVNGVFKVTGQGLKIEAGGVIVYSGGVVVDNGGALTLTRSGGTPQGSLVVTSGGMTIGDYPLNTGLVVTSGGVSVMSGGMIISGGSIGGSVARNLVIASGTTGNVNIAQIETTKLNVMNGGMTINSGGLSCVGGMTSKSLGLNVVGGGVVINADGLKVMDTGLSILDSGLVVGNNNIIVSNIGMLVNDTITGVSSEVGGGLSVTGGVTVSDTGFNLVTGGISIMSSGGLVCSTGNIDIQSSGLHTTNMNILGTGWSIDSIEGMTISTIGLTISSNGMSITNDGLQIVSGGLIINNDGISVINNITVYGVTRLQSSPVIFSDVRLKKNIVPLHNSLHQISKLRGVYFSWRNDDDFLKFDNDRHIGMIAQEVYEVFPELVHEIKHSNNTISSSSSSSVNNVSYLGINYPDMIPIVIEAVKELNNKMNSLLKLYDDDRRSGGSNLQTNYHHHHHPQFDVIDTNRKVEEKENDDDDDDDDSHSFNSVDAHVIKSNRHNIHSFFNMNDSTAVTAEQQPLALVMSKRNQLLQAIKALTLRVNQVESIQHALDDALIDFIHYK